MASSTLSVDDLQKNLDSYTLQLDTVKAALTTDPENAELLKLQGDLQEVLELTQNLIQQARETGAAGSKDVKSKERKWEVGDLCQAMWSDDGQYYQAVIEDIKEDGKVGVQFLAYGNTDVTEVALLKPVENETDESSSKKQKLTEMLPMGISDKKSALSRKEKIIAEREAKKKKNAKKKERQQKLEQAREEDKNKWQQFNKKTFSKTKKGQVKKSIFASPTTVDGRVGVGTCGVADKPMTESQSWEKYKTHNKS